MIYSLCVRGNHPGEVEYGLHYLIVRQVNAKEMLELGVRAPEASIPRDLALPTGHCSEGYQGEH